MAEHRILWLPGDGVGPEISTAARLVLEAVELDAEYINGDIGWHFWCTEGDALPARTIEQFRDIGVAFFGAITSKGKAAYDELAPELKGKGLKYVSPIVRMRQVFNLYKCIRPCRSFPGNPLNYLDNIDLVVFRENTQGLYAGIEFDGAAQDELTKEFIRLIKSHPKGAAYNNVDPATITASVRLFDAASCNRIIRAGFEWAKKHGKSKVTVVEKPNVVRKTSGQMVAEAEKVAADFPDIYLEHTNIDAQCMWLIKNPLDYGVLVSSNMFGDILSDLCAQLVGGLGFAYSGNIGDEYAVFEPTAGSAPKYEGQWRMNPIAAILAAKFMLEHIGEMEKADAIEKAVARVIAQRQVMTYDMQRSIKPSPILQKLRSFARNVPEGDIGAYREALATLDNILSEVEQDWNEDLKKPAKTIDMTVAILQALDELGYADKAKIRSLDIESSFKEQIALNSTLRYLENL